MALRRRLVTTLNALRAAVSHPHILDVPASMTGKVQTFLIAFERMVNSCDLVISGAASEWDAALDEAPWRGAKFAEKLLLQMLHNATKARQLEK